MDSIPAQLLAQRNLRLHSKPITIYSPPTSPFVTAPSSPEVMTPTTACTTPATPPLPLLFGFKDEQVVIDSADPFDKAVPSTHLDRINIAHSYKHSPPTHNTYLFSIGRDSESTRSCAKSFISIPHLGSSTQACKALNLSLSNVLEEWIGTILCHDKRMGRDSATAFLDIVCNHLTKVPPLSEDRKMSSPMTPSLSPESQSLFQSSLTSSDFQSHSWDLNTNKQKHLGFHLLLGPTSQLGEWCCEDPGVHCVARSILEEPSSDSQDTSEESYFVDILATLGHQYERFTQNSISSALLPADSNPSRNQSICVSVNLEYIESCDFIDTSNRLIHSAGLCAIVNT